ncbi:MAG TPA: hypothetical protein VGA37_10600 [Gemmatimonadales bacterium]
MTYPTTADQIETQAPRPDSWTDVFRWDVAIHMLIMASITAATFQGYLKDRFGGPLPYVLADVCLIGAVLIWFGGMAVRHAPLRAPGLTAALVLGSIIVPTLYVMHPGSSFVLSIAGLRAWSAYPFACLVALTTIRSRGQVEAYVRLILLLCVITAVYGIRQYIQGPDIALGTNLGALRHGTTVFYDIAGTTRTDFRAFSTFTFPAPFAGMMVFGILLAAGIATSRSEGRWMRLTTALLIPVFFVGMTVSGTRAAIVVLLVGLMVLGAFRGMGIRQVVLMPLLLAAVHVATLLTAGRIIERYRSLLLRETVIWSYVSQPITIAWNALRHDLFGVGLGRTGVGVPMQIVNSYPADYFVFSDGDIGRAAVELGVFGVALLLVILIGLLPHVVRATRRLSRTSHGGVSLGIGALVVSTGALLLIGSPLSTAPHGTIWWFLLGAVLKLSMVEDDAALAGSAHVP